MSRKKYDINEVRQYAGSHNIIECADHYDVAVTSMYTWLNQHHVDYVHVIAKGERNINKRKLESDEIDILKTYGRIKTVTPWDGWKLLALGVITYAYVDHDNNFPMRDFFEGVYFA